MPIATCGFAAQSESSPLEYFNYSQRDLRDDDVHVEVHFCGICHSDIHQARNEWGGSVFPMVPGHEVAGVVKAVGSKVQKVKVGDHVGIGCFVDSCGTCKECAMDHEQYCAKKVVTYNGRNYDGSPTYGGYGKDLVCKETFILKMPDNLPLDAAAPLLCAGITTYSPMKHWGMDKKGSRIGVIGLGGLGHMAVQFGAAFGNEVTVISRSPSKKDAAVKTLGAKHFLLSTDPKAMAEAAGSLDFIIDTVSAKKNMDQYLTLLDVQGVLVTVGMPQKGCNYEVSPGSLIFRRLSIGGSLVGGIKETQEMLDFCGKNNIVCHIEKIDHAKINEAYDRVLKSDVRYRFVIDVRRLEALAQN